MTARNQYLKRTYGITERTYNRMFRQQKGLCAICERPPKKRRLAVDHCHRTSTKNKCVVRGLLCMRCNRGLAWFYDKPERFEAAATYLRRPCVCMPRK